jgi:rubredoxin
LDSKPASLTIERERVMAAIANGELPNPTLGTYPGTRLIGLPRNNPCAQCGQPIPFPDWVENGARRAAYLWQCRACDYRFEAVAFFADHDANALAA